MSACRIPSVRNGPRMKLLDALARHDGEANRVVDEHEGHEHQQHDQGGRGDADDVGHVEQAVHRVGRVEHRRRGHVGILAHRQEQVICHDALGHRLGQVGVGQRDHQRGRQGVAPVQGRHRVLGVGRDHGAAVLLQGLVLALVGDAVHALPRVDVSLQLVDHGLVGVIGEKRLDGDARLHVAQHAVDHEAGDGAHADTEQRQEDRDHGAEARGPVAREVTAGLAHGITEVIGHHSSRTLRSARHGRYGRSPGR